MMATIGDLAERASTSALFMDFDGTLSEVVPRPEDARPLPEIPSLLSDLSRSFAAVAVVSGRSAHQLAEWLGPDVEIWGLHGAERTEGGRVVLSDVVRPHLPSIAAARADAQARFDQSGAAGCLIEDKGAMLGLHFRNAPDPERAEPVIRRIAEDVASDHGLIVIEGRMVFELRPRVELSKRDVVEGRVRELALTGACFIGDDTVDLPAYDALDALEARGGVGVRIAVRSDEAPPALIERADIVVEGPSGVVELLDELRRLTTEA